MEEFYNRYLRACKECNVSPLECVDSQMQLHNKDGERILDLSSCSLSPEDCFALAKTFALDTFFKDVRFTDCLLSEDSSKILLCGFFHIKSLKTLDLKGNNLRSSGAEIVGLFLTKNTSVRCLRLDWNSLGIWGSGLGKLAEGLVINQTLLVLDLRNNQISHHGAKELALALKSNSTLKTLDLRWNNAGLLGARAFLSALQYNKSLTILELQGNNVPQDIVKAITVALNLNAERESARNEEAMRTEKMMKTIEKIEFENTMQVSMLQKKLDAQGKENEELSKSSSDRINLLKKSLKESEASFNEISAQVESLKNETAMKDNKIYTLEKSLIDVRNELSSEKAQRTAIESDFQRLKEEKSKLDITLAELKEHKLASKDSILKLENDIAKTIAEHKNAMTDLKASNERALVELVDKNAKEVEYLRANYEELEGKLKGRIECVEKEKIEAQEQVSLLKSELVSNGLKHKEEMLNTTTQLKHEQRLSSKQYEDRLNTLQNSRDELHSQANKYLAQISELQKEVGQLRKDLSDLKAERDAAESEWRQKENKNMAEVSRLRVELESEKRIKNDLEERIMNVEADAKNRERQQKDMLAEKAREIESLEQKVLARETDLKRQREDEMRRAELLQSAISTYVSSTRSSTFTSPSK